MVQISHETSMTYKINLLRLLLDLDTYRLYRHHVTPDKDKHQEKLFEVLDQLIDTHGRSIIIDEYLAALEAHTDGAREKDKQVYDNLIATLKEPTIGNDVAESLLFKIRQKNIVEKLGIASFEFLEGSKSIDDVRSLYDQLEQIDEEKKFEFAEDDIEIIYENTLAKPGLRWRLNTLNRMLGSLRKGDFGFIFARPETGKTTFLASEVTFFASQAKDPILWFNNEEQEWKVLLRCYEAALGKPLDALVADRAQTRKDYLSITRGNIKVINATSLHYKNIEAYCEKYKPSLIISDQIDKTHGFKGDRDDLKLGAIYQWYRELAKKYAPVIGICQADGTGEGVKFLTMGHVANAKTSKQAEADFILGIGKSNDETEANIRYLNISKNKLIGDNDSDKDKRHGRAAVIIDTELARYRDY